MKKLNARLMRLLESDYYPIVKKRNFTERQIEELIRLYDLFCVKLATIFFENYIISNELKFMLKNEKEEISLPKQLEEVLVEIKTVKEIESKIFQIRHAFKLYKEKYRDLYEYYELEYYLKDNLNQIIERGWMIIKTPVLLEFLCKYWRIEFKVEPE